MRRTWAVLLMCCLASSMLMACSEAVNGASSHSSMSTNSMMKVYPYDSSSSIGKTSPKDDATSKNVIFPQPDIPGLNIATVVLNMQNDWGMNPINAGFNGGWYTYRGERSDNGISEGYGVQWRSPYKVDVVDFSLVTSKNDTNVTAYELKSAAIQYLGYAATLPYTGAIPQLAKQWVVHELQTYHGKGVVGHQIGKVYFMLDPYEKLSDNQKVSELTIAASTMGNPSSVFK